MSVSFAHPRPCPARGPLRILVLAAVLAASSASAQAAPSCTFQAYPAPAQPIKHTVQIDVSCAAVSASSPDSQWSYVDERVTSSRPMRTYELGGTGFGPALTSCAFTPSALDCPIPVNLAQASDPYLTHVMLTYPAPLQCGDRGPTCTSR